jgi:hypothetical protein
MKYICLSTRGTGIAVTLLALALIGSPTAQAQPVPDTEQINYFSNANTTGGHASLRIIDPFEAVGLQPEDLCAMIYVFDTHQALQECCGCPVSADGLLTLDIDDLLASNPVADQNNSGNVITDGIIEILSTRTNDTVANESGGPLAGEFCTPVIPTGPGAGVCCDPTGSAGALVLTPTLRAWAGHVQNTNITEEEFADVPTSSESDAAALAGLCADAVDLGSGSGTCVCAPESLSTPTPSPTPTPTPTADSPATATPTPSPTPTATETPTPTPTPTDSATPIATETPSPTPTPTDSPTPTATATATAAPTATPEDVAAVVLCPSEGATPASSPGSSGNYTLLAGQSVTNTGPTTIDGNLGVSPGATTPPNVTGAPVVTGFTDDSNANSLNGENILGGAITDAAGRTPSMPIDPELGGQTLVGGVYSPNTGGAFSISSDLTLSGDSSTIWIFQMASTLTTTTGNIVLEGGADGCNVFWQVGSSATLGTNTTFYGNIMATTSITLTTGATIPKGRALAQNGSVTLDSNTIGGCTCP